MDRVARPVQVEEAVRVCVARQVLEPAVQDLPLGLAEVGLDGLLNLLIHLEVSFRTLQVTYLSLLGDPVLIIILAIEVCPAGT